MRLYTVSSIDAWLLMKKPTFVKRGQAPRKAKDDVMIPRLGKNGGRLCKTSGMISSMAICRRFVAAKRLEGVVSVSKIRKWKGN